MKTDTQGCSTCQKGKESYEQFYACKKIFFQYDYRHVDGSLFSCVAPTIKKCREKKTAG